MNDQQATGRHNPACLLSLTEGNYLKTVRSRVIVVAMAGIVIVSIIYMICSVRMQQIMTRDEIERRAEVVSGMVSLISADDLASGSLSRIEDLTALLQGVPEVVSVSFFDSRKRLLHGRNDPLDRHGLDPYQDRTTLHEETDHYDIYTPVYAKHTVKTYDRTTQPDLSEKAAGPIGWVRIAFSRESVREVRTHAIIRVLLIAISFMVGVSVVVSLLFSSVTRTLSQLLAAVRSIRDGRYPDTEMTAGGEIGELAAEFSRMSKAINRREDLLVVRARFSQFSADVGNALTEGSDLPEMVSKCAEVCRQYTMATCVGIWLSDLSDDVLKLQTVSGTFQGSAFPTAMLAHGDASAGHISGQKLPCATRNPSAIPWFNNREFMLANGIQFYAGYPIILETRLIGVLELYSQHPFCWDLLNTLDALSDSMAMGFERKIIEERMKDSLEEKEVLLREIHHRIKNKMQVISSLLNLQSETIADLKYREIFSESKNRIRAMALIHEKLYQTKDISNIEFGDYIASLANGLFMFYGVSASRVELVIEAEGVVIGIDTAMPCGLIINELLSNALKYAFPGGRAGVIRIAISKTACDGNNGIEYALTVSDNGIGLPEGFDFRTAKSLGLHLVVSLAEHQLQGSMRVNRDSGTMFRILFRDAKYRKRV